MYTISKRYLSNEGVKIKDLNFFDGIFAYELAVDMPAYDYIDAIGHVRVTIELADCRYYVTAYSYSKDGRRYALPTINNRVRKDIKLSDVNARIIDRYIELNDIVFVEPCELPMHPVNVLAYKAHCKLKSIIVRYKIHNDHVYKTGYKPLDYEYLKTCLALVTSAVDEIEELFELDKN